jgi:hypothetical protein
MLCISPKIQTGIRNNTIAKSLSASHHVCSFYFQIKGGGVRIHVLSFVFCHSALPFKSTFFRCTYLCISVSTHNTHVIANKDMSHQTISKQLLISGTNCMRQKPCEVSSTEIWKLKLQQKLFKLGTKTQLNV